MKRPRLLRFLFRNAGWKLLSLAIAVLLWITVASEPELSTFASVPVEYKNVPSDLEISSPVVTSVYLELRGPAGELRNFSERRAAVVLDMTQAQPGERTFTIGRSNVVLPRALRMMRAVPSQLRIEFQEVATRRVPVEARFSHPPPPGYTLGAVSVIPPEVVISGPAAHVNAVRAAVTDSIDLGGITGADTFHVSLFISDPEVRFHTAPRVAVTVTIKPEAAAPPQ